jgi:hypothetical protein
VLCTIDLVEEGIVDRRSNGRDPSTGVKVHRRNNLERPFAVLIDMTLGGRRKIGLRKDQGSFNRKL